MHRSHTLEDMQKKFDSLAAVEHVMEALNEATVDMNKEHELKVVIDKLKDTMPMLLSDFRILKLKNEELLKETAKDTNDSASQLVIKKGNDELSEEEEEDNGVNKLPYLKLIMLVAFVVGIMHQQTSKPVYGKFKSFCDLLLMCWIFNQ